MNVTVASQNEMVDISEIKAVLHDELVQGCVAAISPCSRNSKMAIIKLRTNAKNESIGTICRKLNDIGYNTKVFLGNVSSSRNIGGIRTPQKNGRGIDYTFNRCVVIRGAVYIVASRVIIPGRPDNPPALPDPGGKSPSSSKK